MYIRKKKPGRAALERAEKKKAEDAVKKAAGNGNATEDTPTNGSGAGAGSGAGSGAATPSAAGTGTGGGGGSGANTPSVGTRGNSSGSSRSGTGTGIGSGTMTASGSVNSLSGSSTGTLGVGLSSGGSGVLSPASPNGSGHAHSGSSSSSSSAAAGGGGGGGRGGADKKEKEKAPASDIPEEPELGKRIGDYQLMEMLGKGGFGAVYRGLNVVTGSTVAIKRIGLHGIPREELESIEMEIKLLQNLDHPNIVKYIDASRTEAHLNIILEFVENGSLSHLLTKFGGYFPESLVSHYTMQVLRGLHYLHKQGVIHRDIKGANILTTKDGLVKLADFGVATKLNESRKSDSVVGTPYWMAPEIIEMTGQQSSACDIWSVGCTVIELLTGKPPYFDLQQMPALFRIVQDEHPPLPDAISPALQDFLMQCFQKDPNRRIDAKGLMKHYWLKQAHEEEEKKKKAQEAAKQGRARASISLNPLAAAQVIAAATGKPAPATGAGAGAGAGSSPALVPKTHAGVEEPDWDADSGDDDAPKKVPAQPSLVKAPEKGKLANSLAVPGDFMSKVSSQKLPAQVVAAATSGARSPKVVPATPPAKSPTAGPPRLPGSGSGNSKPSSSDSGSDDQPLKIKQFAVDGDDDPFAGMDDDDPKPIKAAGKSSPASVPPPTTRPASASSVMVNAVLGSPAAANGAAAGADAASPNVAKPLHTFAEGDDDDGFEIDENDLDPARLAETKRKQAAESDAFGTAKRTPAAAAAGSKTDSISMRSGSVASASGAGGDGVLGDDDPFADIPFEDADSGAAAEEKKLAKEFNSNVISKFNPKSTEEVIIAACEKLDAMFSKQPEPIRNLMTSHGVIPVMEMMESKNKKILLAILRVVNKIIGKNQKFQQNMSLVGLIPAIINLAGPHYAMNIRLEAANFVRQFCYASEFTRKMFVACGGLPVLVGFLEEDYSNSQILVFNAVDCIRHVFEINSNPKNDFCRLFCKFGLLPPLAATLLRVNRDAHEQSQQQLQLQQSAGGMASPGGSGSDAASYLLKIAKILHLFSQADSVVKHAFARREVLDCVFAALPTLPHECLLLVLKSIRQIAMDSGTLDLLEASGAIPALMPYFNSPQPEVANQVLLSMYYLCQLTPSRQEQAAVCGIIPHLQRIIRANHPLKQFAFPIIFLLGRTNRRTRMELKKYSGVEFYLDLLRDVYWRSPALEVLSKWLSEDRQRVEFILNAHIGKLFTVFKATKEALQFQNLLISFHRILKASIRVNRSFGRSSLFLSELKQRFEKHAGDNNIRINLIKILNLIYDSHTEPVRLIRDHGFVDLLQRLSTDATFHLGVPLAKELLKKYNQSLSGGSASASASGITVVSSHPAAAGAAAAGSPTGHSGFAPPPFVPSASSPNLFVSKPNTRLFS